MDEQLSEAQEKLRTYSATILSVMWNKYGHYTGLVPNNSGGNDLLRICPSDLLKHLLMVESLVVTTEDRCGRLAKILAKKEVALLVDPLLTDDERDTVFDAITALGGEQ